MTKLEIITRLKNERLFTENMHYALDVSGLEEMINNNSDEGNKDFKDNLKIICEKYKMTEHLDEILENLE